MENILLRFRQLERGLARFAWAESRWATLFGPLSRSPSSFSRGTPQPTQTQGRRSPVGVSQPHSTRRLYIFRSKVVARSPRSSCIARAKQMVYIEFVCTVSCRPLGTSKLEAGEKDSRKWPTRRLGMKYILFACWPGRRADLPLASHSRASS